MVRKGLFLCVRDHQAASVEVSIALLRFPRELLGICGSCSCLIGLGRFNRSAVKYAAERRQWRS